MKNLKFRQKTLGLLSKPSKFIWKCLGSIQIFASFGKSWFSFWKAWFSGGNPWNCFGLGFRFLRKTLNQPWETLGFLKEFCFPQENLKNSFGKTQSFLAKKLEFPMENLRFPQETSRFQFFPINKVLFFLGKAWFSFLEKLGFLHENLRIALENLSGFLRKTLNFEWKTLGSPRKTW